MCKTVAMLFTLIFILPFHTRAQGERFPVEPYPDNVEREQGDNGFSRGFGMTNHSFSFDWFDSHMHLAWSHFPNVLKGSQIQEVVDRWLGMAGIYHCKRMILHDPYLETEVKIDCFR